MVEKKQMGVVEQMAWECVFAYRTHTPLIFLDTQDVELITRVVLACDKREDFVTLKTAQSDSDALAPYYRYLHGQNTPPRLDRCVNFSVGPEKLMTFPEDKDGNPIPHPQLFVLHLDKRAGEVIQLLRSFVLAYIYSLPHSYVKNSCVLLYGDLNVLSEDLKCRTAVVEEPYPKLWEIDGMLRTKLELEKERYSGDVEDFLKSKDFGSTVTAMTGLRYLQVERVIQTLLLPGEEGRPMLFSPGLPAGVIRREKEKILRQNGGVLELVDQTEPVMKPCGMKNFSKWVERNCRRLENPREYVAERGVLPLKGTLMCGVPGCGKSEAARWLSSKLGLPLVKMNMDQLMGGLVGQSEQNLRTALSIAEAMAPCVVWVDELDKVIMSANSASRQDPTSSRMLSRLLQWLQSNKHGCFVFATANDIGLLPQELLRKGRFDTLWSVFLPTQSQCMKIFADHMRKANEDRRKAVENAGREKPKPLFCETGETDNCFSDTVLAELVGYFSKEKKFLTGADIASIVSEGLTRLEARHFQDEIKADTWKKEIKKVAKEIITDVSRQDSLNKTAANYIRLMRYSFLPASDELLFVPKRYKVKEQEDGFSAGYYGAIDDGAGPYDQELFDTLNAVINRHATRYEQLLSDKTFS